MRWTTIALLIAGVLLRPSETQETLPVTVLNCCEGDIVIVLDASSSVAAYEFTHMIHFLSELLGPFQLGRGHVRVGLLQVGTEPRVEFGLDGHTAQSGLRWAIRNTQQLQGDTNTVEALRLAQRLLGVRPGDKRRDGPPKVLLWLTDGVEPGPVEEPARELRRAGVAVLAVSTGSSNYQVLRRTVSPPVEDHLHFVDVDDISIITEDLRDAIIEIIRADRLQVRDITSRSAVLQWRPVLTAHTGTYELTYGPSADGAPAGGRVGGPGTSTTSNRGSYVRQILPGDHSTWQLKQLRPGTTYTASLRPESNQQLLKALSVSFTTLSDVSVAVSPTTVSISESGPDSVRVSWGPLQPSQVRRYQVEYAVLPSGEVRTVNLRSHENSTLLTQLRPDSQYLVTVTALHLNGQERAMSVKACTQEVVPPLEDLQLRPAGQNSVQVEWRGRVGGPQGYWVSWDGARPASSRLPPSPSSLYLPSSSASTFLTHLAPNSRVCVSPVYKTARGQGLCCTHTHSDSWQ
ncbi:von Willebrand factor A domain-containing protein 1-like [Sardina pilchardus]|uniref:von Willebrand factor A domain-containing protein 1-like n=1 Tax=Sardina pilchardus TaxID=27697 RepID=UPI002E0E0E7E